ncbi:TPA: 50S ribosomal protein L32 [Candidatus Dependentiae bacterium]|nr:MAG: 50S ribosomal protein L32 [candidate division TM6 bacterium GW2011_GWF2_33_332]HBS48113.1 50S ribosomal protein L32 [Candidatus Dependentiae bacterium]HBZ73537.1 50S ribosomal protein L32 [Candidatus Dependentiae bacterium]
MPVPKRKVSKSRRDKRSANKKIAVKAVCVCLTCQAPISSHQVCSECGYYKGKKIIQTKTDRMYKRGESRRAKEAVVAKHNPAEETFEKQQ